MRITVKSVWGTLAFLVVIIRGAVSGEPPVSPADSAMEDSNPMISKSLLPFAIYDSDIGFGFGAKAVVKNLESKHSYDVIVFGSTLGEQWYAFSFSTLDANLRRDSLYALAFDFGMEYDKLLKSSYFGLGNSTSENEDQFPRELFEIEATASHAFSRVIDGGLSVRLAHRSVYGYDTDWSSGIARAPGIGESQLFALGSGLNYDTRDDVINPGRGIRMAITVERAMKFAGFEWDFWKGRVELSRYQTIARENNILAARLWLQEVSAGAPFQELSKIGDGWTARGYRAGRFLDRAMALTSLEYRCPIYARFGGVVFVDVGRVWPTLREFNLDSWHGNWGGGLRYYLANFVGRLDIGKSPEGMRIFFNFGQVF